MKIKRHKHIKRVLKFFKINFNMDTSAFNVLIDGTFAHEALNCKINLAEQLPKFFGVPEKKCQLLTTKCAVHETELLGRATNGAMLILKQYPLVECKHKRNFVSSEKCIRKIIEDSKNSDIKYVIAAQSESLKEIVREQPGVPLMVISHNAINLESPSEKTVETLKQTASDKLVLDLDVIKKLKNEIEKSKEVKRIFKSRKPKGPNPLSCKKSKKNISKKPNDANNNKKR